MIVGGEVAGRFGVALVQGVYIMIGTLLIFGVNWAAFLVFMPLLFSGYLTDVILRIMIDPLLVTIGYYLAFRPGVGFRPTSLQ